MARERRFPDPHDFMDLPGAEGWREMYPSHMQFQAKEPARSYESSQLWTNDSLHVPRPMLPLEALPFDCMVSEYPNARALCVPTSIGADRKILNGWVYIAGVVVTDPQEVEKRAKIFDERISYILANWDVLYGVIWHQKMMDLINTVKAIQIAEHFSEVEDISAIKEGRGDSEGLNLVESYSKMIDAMYRMWSYHHYYNIVAYFVYASRREALMKLFPGIGDKSIVKMFQGFEAALFRPPAELRKLATSAVELGIADTILGCAKWDEVPSKLQQTESGGKWLQEFEVARDPWFEMSIGSGLCPATDIPWNDDLDFPFGDIRRYIEALKRGESIERPITEVIEEKDRVTNEYRDLIKTDEDKAAFDNLIAVSRKVAPYAEDHNFYCENWFTSIFWRKIRQIGQFLVNHGVLKDKEDIWYINHVELRDVIDDVRHGWYTGTEPVGKSLWPAKIERRKEIMEVFKKWRPEPAFGPAPEEITDPLIISLYGMTTETVDRWLEAKELKPEEITKLSGFAGSGGVVEGKARVCLSAAEIPTLQAGEILVCPSTAPNWAPVFQIIRGVVTDVGGVFSHAAIVSREYGIPAVVATGIGTQVINTSDKIRVDGDRGVVEMIERAK